MDEKYFNSIKELNLAGLSNDQQNKLRDFEKQFNHEFGTDYYFMVMDRSK